MTKEENIENTKFNYDTFLDETHIIEERKQIDLILNKIKLSFKESNKNFIN